MRLSRRLSPRCLVSRTPASFRTHQFLVCAIGVDPPIGDTPKGAFSLLHHDRCKLSFARAVDVAVPKGMSNLVVNQIRAVFFEVTFKILVTVEPTVAGQNNSIAFTAGQDASGFKRSTQLGTVYRRSNQNGGVWVLIDRNEYIPVTGPAAFVVQNPQRSVSEVTRINSNVTFSGERDPTDLRSLRDRWRSPGVLVSSKLAVTALCPGNLGR